MSPFDLTRKALFDLEAIALYTEEQWGKAQRNRYIKDMDRTFRLLAKSPALGKRCDDVLPGYRKFPQGSHMIYYKPGTQHAVIIIRILHKNMDVESQFSGESSSQ